VDLSPMLCRFGRLWYGEPNTANNAISYAKSYSRSQDAVIAFSIQQRATVVEDRSNFCLSS